MTQVNGILSIYFPDIHIYGEYVLISLGTGKVKFIPIFSISNLVSKFNLIFN